MTRGESDRTLRLYLQVGDNRMKMVAESHGPKYAWASTEYSEGWGGPEASVVIHLARRLK
jgi:hypothetical protein